MSAHGSTSGQRRCWVSFAAAARRMLAVWIDRDPFEEGSVRDPEGWVTGADGSEFEAHRLAELAHAPDVKLVWLQSNCAEVWAQRDMKRRSAQRKRVREEAARAQSLIPIPEDVEKLGREAALERELARVRRGVRR